MEADKENAGSGNDSSSPVIVMSGEASTDALTEVTVARLKEAGSAESAMIAQEYLKA